MLRKNRMKLILVVWVCCSWLPGCVQDEDPLNMEYRTIAWNALTEQEKLTVTHDWKDAVVELSECWETNQPAMSVTFNTTQDPLLGPIVAYIEPDTKVLLGFAMRL